MLALYIRRMTIGAAFLKKPNKELGTLRRQHALVNLDPMVEKIRIRDPKLAPHSPKANIAGPENKSTNASRHQRAGAHNARLQRGINRRLLQSVVAECPRCFPKGDDLGMCGGVDGTNRRVSPSSHDALVQHHDR